MVLVLDVALVVVVAADGLVHTRGVDLQVQVGALLVAV
jgi:hypothetical protein